MTTTDMLGTDRTGQPRRVVMTRGGGISTHVSAIQAKGGSLLLISPDRRVHVSAVWRSHPPTRPSAYSARCGRILSAQRWTLTSGTPDQVTCSRCRRLEETP